MSWNSPNVVSNFWGLRDRCASSREARLPRRRRYTTKSSRMPMVNSAMRLGSTGSQAWGELPHSSALALALQNPQLRTSRRSHNSSRLIGRRSLPTGSQQTTRRTTSRDNGSFRAVERRRESRQANPLQRCTTAADYSCAAVAVGRGRALGSRFRPDCSYTSSTDCSASMTGVRSAADIEAESGRGDRPNFRLLSAPNGALDPYGYSLAP